MVMLSESKLIPLSASNHPPNATSDHMKRCNIFRKSLSLYFCQTCWPDLVLWLIYPEDSVRGMWNIQDLKFIQWWISGLQLFGVCHCKVWYLCTCLRSMTFRKIVVLVCAHVLKSGCIERYSDRIFMHQKYVIIKIIYKNSYTQTQNQKLTKSQNYNWNLE